MKKTKKPKPPKPSKRQTVATLPKKIISTINERCPDLSKRKNLSEKELASHKKTLDEGMNEIQKAREKIEFYKSSCFKDGPVPEEVVDEANKAIEQMTTAMEAKIASYAKGQHFNWSINFNSIQLFK